MPKLAGFAPESFSHVLLDAPCTALGLRPKLQQPLTLRELLDTAAYQRQLLAAAVRLVKPGGFLVYSTCSVSPGERWGGGLERLTGQKEFGAVSPGGMLNVCLILFATCGVEHLAAKCCCCCSCGQ